MKASEKMSISAIVITKDEERMLGQCLSSLRWAHEVLVIDTGSKDKTIEIAKKKGARVVNYHNGRNFSQWRNKGLEEAKGEWVFYVDADERVEDGLADEIKDVTGKGLFGAYAIPRRNFMFGKEMKHIGVPPDYVKRLFKKDALAGWKGELHEEPRFRGQLGYLENALVHIKHESFTEMVEKTNKWSQIEAKLMFDAGHPPMNIPRFITAMGREFWQRMVVHRAFLDGSLGVVYALYQVFSRFVSYAKLWEMQLKAREEI